MDSINFKVIRNQVKKEVNNRRLKNQQMYKQNLKEFNDCYGVKERNIEGNTAYLKDDYYDMDSKNEILFTHIKKKTIGKSVALREENFKIIKGIHIEYNIFEKCTFQNVKFQNCTFCGCEFKNCSTIGAGVVFEGCIFVKPEFEENKEITDVYNYATTFNNCNFSVSFRKCNMEYVVFENGSLILTKFQEVNLQNVIISNLRLYNINFQDCDCRSMKIIESLVHEIYFSDLLASKFDENTFLDKIIFEKNDEEEYRYAFNSYKVFASKFNDNNLQNHYGEYYYLSKKVERRFTKGFSKVKSLIYWITCGYGERPINSLLFSILIIALFAFYYMLNGIIINGVPIEYDWSITNSEPIGDIIQDYFKFLHFSVVTFTTVGYGNIVPSEKSSFFSGIEMFLGVTMAGLWTGTLARKMTR